MEDIYKIAGNGGISDEELKEALQRSLVGRMLKKVLILPPDFTRFHSQAGKITSIYYQLLTDMGAQVDIMPALGTHEPVSKEQWEIMFKGIPYENMIVHDWRHDVVKIGEVPASYLEEITEGLWHEPVSVEINRRVMDESYDLIISPGQVVPHEVIGMANHSKNLFVGVGGSDMINKSHMVGAVYGMERMMGKDHTPVRKIFDYGMEHFLSNRPILFVLTVCTAPVSESELYFTDSDVEKYFEVASSSSSTRSARFPRPWKRSSWRRKRILTSSSTASRNAWSISIPASSRVHGSAIRPSIVPAWRLRTAES